MSKHSPEEWQALLAELHRMIESPNTPRDKRQRAQRILDEITRPVGMTSTALLQGKEGRKRDSRGYQTHSQFEYDGTIR